MQTTNFTFKRYNFHQENTTNLVKKFIFLSTRFSCAYLEHFIVLYKNQQGLLELKTFQQAQEN